MRDEAFVGIQRHGSSRSRPFIICPECLAVVVNSVSVLWIERRRPCRSKESERNGCGGDDRYAKDSESSMRFPFCLDRSQITKALCNSFSALCSRYSSSLPRPV